MAASAVAIGEILWDVFPGHERLGGATFNFAAHLARLGGRVAFVSAVGRDERGSAAALRAAEFGLDLRWLKRVDRATGVVEVSLDQFGKPTFRLIRPAAYDDLRLDDRELAEIADLRPGWLYYGTLHQMVPSIRALVLRLMDAVPSATRFYDVNLRPDCHTPELVESLLARSHVVKLSDDEAAVLGPMLGVAHDPLPRFCEVLARRLGLRAVCVTQGALGASMWREGEFSVAPGEPVEVVDTVGAGDAFAAALVAGLDAGWPSDRVLREANRQGARVAAQAGAVS